MNLQDSCLRRAEAVAEFDRHEHRTDGTQVVRSLADGLSLCATRFSSACMATWKKFSEPIPRFSTPRR